MVRPRLCVICALLTSMDICAGAPLPLPDGPDDPHPIIIRAMAAHGGRENLVRHARSYSCVKGQAGTALLSIQTWTDASGRSKVVLDWQDNGQKLAVTRVLDGHQGWEKINDKEAVAGSAKDLREAQESLYQRRLVLLYPLLEDKNITLSYLGESKVGDTPVHAVRVASPDRQDVDLHFDKVSGLLLKSECKVFSGMNRGKTIQIYRDNYVDREGVKIAAKVRMILDGRLYSEDELVEYRTIREFEPQTFAKP